MKNSKTSESSHRGHLPKLWKQNDLSESHLGAELARSEHEPPVRLLNPHFRIVLTLVSQYSLAPSLEPRPKLFGKVTGFFNRSEKVYMAFVLHDEIN